MRILAAGLCIVFFTATLLSKASAQDGAAIDRSPRMSKEEAAELAARAASSPELEKFSGGQAEMGGIATVVGIILVPVIAVAGLIGLIAALPLGLTHAIQGKTFLSSEIWNMEPSFERLAVWTAVTIGLPLYSVGFLMGLPFSDSRPSYEKSKQKMALFEGRYSKQLFHDSGIIKRSRKKEGR